MVALCSTHHPLADGGKWTKDQLHHMKSQPYLTGGAVRVQWGWRRDQFLLICGGLYVCKAGTVFQINDEPAVWFTRNSEGAGLNFQFRGAEGEVAIQMIENDWLHIDAKVEVDDVIVPPQGRRLKVHLDSVGLKLEASFYETDNHCLYLELIRRGYTFDSLRKILSKFGKGSVPVCVLTASCKYPIPFDIEEDEVTDELDNRMTKNLGFVAKEGRALYGFTHHIGGNLTHLN